MAKDTAQFLLRLPTDLREQLAEWAKDERRTLTSHIIYLLEQAVARHEKPEQ